MESPESTAPLLTVEDVLVWVRERESVRAAQAELGERLAGLETRLRFASMLMSPERAAQIIGRLDDPLQRVAGGDNGGGAQAFKRGEHSVANGVLDALKDEKGGRAPFWIRDRVAKDLELKGKVTSHSISNALSRLKDRGQLIRTDGLYYLPALWEAIQNGSVIEEHASNSIDVAPTFTSRMTMVAAAMGKLFAPAELRAAAMCEPELSEKISSNPNAVNSWIARELDRGNLVREGKQYRVPSERDGALSDNAASAPSAGEGATSPIENRERPKDLLG